MYESKISDAKWIAYDIPGNVGWIAFLVGLMGAGYLGVLAFGGALCFLFGGLLFREYRKI